MMLITNTNPTDKNLSPTTLKVYLKRWRIEEYLRFKKQQFDYYALSDGIYTILQKTKTGIKKFIKPRLKRRKTQQLSIVDSFA